MEWKGPFIGCVLQAVSLQPALAQESEASPLPTRRVVIEAGIDQWAQHVPVIAPSAARGWGGSGSLRFEQRSVRGGWSAWLAFGNAGLHPAGGESQSRDRAFEGGVGMQRQWRTPWSRGHVRHDAGLRIEAIANADVHTYAFPFAASNDLFAFSLLSLSPVLRSEWTTGRGVLTNDFAVPVFAMADLPYANRKASAFFPLLPLSLSRHQALDERITYRQLVRGVGLEWSYRVALRRMVRTDVRRYARQQLSVAITLPLGRRAP